MSLAVTVITASVPDRTHMLVEAMRSVAAQTHPEVIHLVEVNAHISVAECRNQLLHRVGTDWVAFLDDDDLLDPHHLEVLVARAEVGDVDVVIPHCRFLGDPLPALACCGGYYNRPYDREDLRQHGCWPITVLARVSTLADAGNFSLEDTWEDWSLFNRAADQGARFEVVPVVTWTYNRSGHNNRTAEIARRRRRG